VTIDCLSDGLCARSSAIRVAEGIAQNAYSESERYKGDLTEVYVKNAIRLLAIAYTLFSAVFVTGAEKKVESAKGPFDSRLFDCAHFDTGKSCIRGEVTVVDSKTGRFTVATQVGLRWLQKITE
jgi:hypothetical protein